MSNGILSGEGCVLTKFKAIRGLLKKEIALFFLTPMARAKMIINELQLALLDFCIFPLGTHQR